MSTPKPASTGPAFTVDKTTFLRELNLVLSCAEAKGTIPILSHVLISVDEGRIVLRGTDLIVAMRAECQPVRIADTGSVAIPAKRLHAFLNSLPECEVSISTGANNHVTIKGGTARARIPAMSAETFPEMPTATDTLVTVPLHPFARLISRVIFAISAEESRFTLNGALMELDSADGLMKTTATDGHRMAHAAMPCEGPQDRFEAVSKAIIPLRAMREIQRLANAAPLDATVEISTDNSEQAYANNLFFSTGNRLLVGRKMSGNFPDYQRVMPKPSEKHVTFSRDLLLRAVERVKGFADERSRAVTLSVGDMITVSAQVTEMGEGEDSVPVVERHGEVQISFNADYVTEYLRAIETDNVTMQFRDAQSAALWEPVDDKGAEQSLCVLMPMRI